MFLKKLEIHGFKSFADRKVFEFKDGITGIVGPNGSGKSNVSDAVRWVIGEQSARQLRAGRMEDVIFAGTELRSKAGFAGVSITFDNTDRFLAFDADEVTVTRRVFRSGESEYKINGKECRLKYINELFYDTGIGQDGYSIIGQGQVEKILSGKPEERRELFDEAAGIVKYKARRTKAVKDLKKEEENLIRVSDILNELEGRVPHLKEESDKAKDYLLLKDALKKLDCTAFVSKSDSYREEIKKMEGAISLAKTERDKVAASLEEVRLKSDEIKAEAEGLSLLEEKERELDRKKEDISEREIKIKVGEEQKKNIEERLSDTKKEIGEAEVKLTEKLKSIEETQERVKLLDKEIGSVLEEINIARKKKEELNGSFEFSTVQDIQNRLIDEAGKRQELSAEINNLNYKLSSFEKIKEESEEEKLKINAEIAALKKSTFDLQNLRNDLKEEVEKLHEEVENLDISKREKADKKDKIKKEHSDLSAEFAFVSSQLKSALAIEERYEGYGRSVRRIMELKREVPGIIGLVSDILKTKPGLELAVETALGARAQNIVTDSDKTAGRLIEILKKEKAGRATFLPLSSIKADRRTKEIVRGSGIIGYAVDLVDFEPEFESLVNFIFRRTLIVDNMENALSLQRTNGQSLSIVTLEGEHLSQGGAITGGAFKLRAGEEGPLKRKRKIIDAENKLKDIKEKRDNCETTLLNMEKDIEAIKLKTEEALACQKNTADKFQKFDIEYKAKIRELETLEERKEKVSDNSYEEEIFKLKSLTAGKEKELKELELNKDALNDELIKARENAEISKKESDKAVERFNLLTGKHEANIQKKLFLEESKRRIIAEKLEIDEEKKNKLQKEQDLLGDLEEINRNICDATKEAERLRVEFNDLKESIDGDLKRKEELEALSGQILEKREGLIEEKASVDAEIIRLEASFEKISTALDSFTAYMWDEYELTYSYAKEYFDENLIEADVDKESKVVKNKIKALGYVNVASIEEYREVNERYEFIKQQVEDLTKASNALKKVISDLDRGMKRQFEHNFAIIRQSFKSTFRELFGGGGGDLILENPEAPLESDITITGQPSGKKLVSMLQLSGGEKALTAISLLFAIQKLNPSNFCILDEIEAALDEANVVRFASYLNKLSDKIQFIVITHRRGTMNLCDRLYGVTMQEKGVSTVVSVNLE